MKQWILALAVSCSATVFAQTNIEFKAANFKEDKEGFKKAETAIETGDGFFNAGIEAFFNVQPYGINFKKALMSYEEAQKFNPNSATLNYKIGVCHANSTDPGKCIPYIKMAQKLNPDCDPFLNYFLGYAYQLEGKFDEATKAYQAFENNYKKSDNFNKFLVQHKRECQIARESMAKPVRAWVDNIEELNTAEDEIAPSVSVDGAEMIFSSNRKNAHKADEVGAYDYDIYSSSFSDGNWSAPKPLAGPINGTTDDVSNCFSYNGTKMLLHRENAGQTDIYESKLVGAEWSNPQILSPMICSDRANDKYASYDPDGFKIYFTRENINGLNGSEIMFSAVQNKMKQDFQLASQVVQVNSKFNDGPVYIHVSGDIMYMASQGHESMGGYDIFISEKKQGQWSTPVNAGSPINTPYDDFFFAVGANGKFAYIASNRAGGKGGFDIYRVTFFGPEKKPVVETEDYLLGSIAKPVKDHTIESTVDVNKKSLTVFKGITIDAISRKPVEAQIDIIDNATGQVIETFTTNSATGKFIITLNSGKNYGIAVKATGYLFHSENFDIPTGAADNLVNKTIELKNIAIGSKIALRNIFFDVNKATLRPESNAELERLVKLMKDVPNLKIEISGHTDNTGSATVNETLSQQRAEAVVSYLTGKGISASRMKAKGYGSSRPVATNNSDDGRQQNRRTEFEITGN